MAIIDRHVETKGPYFGLSPKVLNAPAEWVGWPKASASNAVFTTSNHFTSSANNSSFAPGTQPDVARNVVVRLTPSTGSAALYNSGTVILYGKDCFGSTRAESFAATALNTISAGINGSVNFQQLQTISVSNLQLHTNSSSAGSNVSLHVGVGQVIGIPVQFLSTDAIQAVRFGTAPQFQFDGASSSNNQWTAVTGPYYKAGISLSSAYASGTVLQVFYKLLGHNKPIHD